MKLITDTDFLIKFDEYVKENKENIIKLTSFLNSLTINPNYHNKKNTRYYNNQDKSIKSINNFLNICTTINIEEIVPKILKLINEHIVNDILILVINKCISEPGYIDIYIIIIENIVNKYKLNLSIIIDKMIDTNYIEKSYTNDYNGLCEYNQSSDKCIALSLLISKLEKNKLLNNYTKKIIELSFNKINIKNNDITFKYICCLFKIFECNKLLINIFYDNLFYLKENVINKKNKFKVMDILDLKN